VTAICVRHENAALYRLGVPARIRRLVTTIDS
jgi:hypothetical protein